MRVALMLSLLPVLLGCSTAPTSRNNDPHTVYLLGRFAAPFSKEQLTSTLCERGFDVRSEMGNDIDLVVLGNNPINAAGDGFQPLAELPEYTVAMQRGVPVVTLIDFLAANDLPSAMPR